MKITTIGLDLAKTVFHVVGLDERGKEVMRRKLRRNQVATYFAKLPPCRIGMEACGGAHHWARKLREMGHRVDLIPAQHVKPLVMGNKNDSNDARAIAEALGRAKIHFVAVKTQAQQDLQAVQRMRAQCVKDRTALCHNIRGLLSEYGIVLNRGVSAIRKGIPRLLEDAENGLSDPFRSWLHQGCQRLVELDEHIEFDTRELEQAVGQDEGCRRLQTIPGYGFIVAGAFITVVGDGHAFRRGRDVSAVLGLVPAQHSSGGKDRLALDQQARRPACAVPVGPGRALGGPARRRQGGPAQPLDQPHPPGSGHQQGGGGPGQQDGPYRLGGIAQRHRVSAGLGGTCHA